MFDRLARAEAARKKKAFVAGLLAASLLASSCSTALSAEASKGEALTAELGCLNCHTAGIGPDWAGEWGTRRNLVDGSTAVFDEQYARRAIAEPGVEVVEGYDPVMPAYSLEEEQLSAVIEYLRTGP